MVAGGTLVVDADIGRVHVLVEPPNGEVVERVAAGSTRACGSFDEETRVDHVIGDGAADAAAHQAIAVRRADFQCPAASVDRRSSVEAVGEAQAGRVDNRLPACDTRPRSAPTAGAAGVADQVAVDRWRAGGVKVVGLEILTHDFHGPRGQRRDEYEYGKQRGEAAHHDNLRGSVRREPMPRSLADEKSDGREAGTATKRGLPCPIPEYLFNSNMMDGNNRVNKSAALAVAMMGEGHRTTHDECQEAQAPVCMLCPTTQLALCDIPQPPNVLGLALCLEPPAIMVPCGSHRARRGLHRIAPRAAKRRVRGRKKRIRPKAKRRRTLRTASHHAASICRGAKGAKEKISPIGFEPITFGSGGPIREKLGCSKKRAASRCDRSSCCDAANPAGLVLLSTDYIVCHSFAQIL